MATSRVVPSLLVRIDSRAREGLQQQIYGSIRRAILDGVVGPGHAAPVVPRAGAGPRRVAHDDAPGDRAAPGGGISSARRGSGTSVARSFPTTSSPGRRCAGVAAPAPRRSPARHRARGGARRRLAASPARPAPSGWARPGWICFPSPLVAAREPAAAAVTRGPARLRRSRGLPALREAIAEPRAGGAGHPLRGRPGHGGGRRPAAASSSCAALLLDPGDARGSRSRLSRRAERAAGRGRADRARAASTPRDWTWRRARAARRDARLVYVTPSHQFPLGVPMSLPRRLALLQLGERGARLGDRGRLRQRVPVRRAAASRACTASTSTAA